MLAQRRRRSGLLAALVLLCAPFSWAAENRLEELRSRLAQLEREMTALAGKEVGILDELRVLDAELQLRREEHESAALRLDEVNREIERHDRTIHEIESAQGQREEYLLFRLREIYKGGPEQLLQRMLAADDSRDYWTGLNYASYLSERDADVVREYRETVDLSAREIEELARTRDELARIEQQAALARDSAESARARRASLLSRVQRDREQHGAAMAELQAAARDLDGVVGTVPQSTPRVDVRKHRGLLEWPAPGRVSSGFGNVVHSKFGTEVPHPGWDIEAAAGTNIEAVFDGRVVFADWMRGYGLTVIVDHGGGILSVYAHASAVVVGTDDEVERGQTLGLVGDTGSLRGPFLYFELRQDGQPVDPAAWLRPR